MRLVMGVNEQPRADASLGLAEQMAQVEQSLLRTALRRAGGSASDAAQALKLPRKTFYDKLARYGIKPETFRS
jgi:two-component system C4-dicarboxylate transport response regulator DctD